MRVVDISLPISPRLPVWPGDPPVEIEKLSTIAEGADANVSKISCGVHMGTHVDAPYHFIDSGLGIETLALEILIGPAFVLDLIGVDVIDAGTLEEAVIPDNVERILFKTRNSMYWATGIQTFQEDFVAVDQSGAQWLVDRNVKLVGVDYLSVAPFDSGIPTHQTLLQHNAIIVEGLDLSSVEAGWYDLACLPLKIIAADGAPARAVLMKE
ncbi:MAG: cyclase family protein [Anaerolineales bacterium]|jgi:arylformamidase